MLTCRRSVSVVAVCRFVRYQRRHCCTYYRASCWCPPPGGSSLLKPCVQYMLSFRCYLLSIVPHCHYRTKLSVLLGRLFGTLCPSP